MPLDGLDEYQEAVLSDLDRRDRLEYLTDRGQVAQRTVVSVSGQGHLVKVRVHDGRGRVGGGVRGVVRGFSRKARKRLLEFVSRLDDQRVQGSSPLFVTLTYPLVYPSDEVAKRVHLRRFLAAMDRRFAGISERSGIWRMEHQHRGAPHFHCMFYGLPFSAGPVIQALWRKAIEYEGPHRLQVDVRAINGWRQAAAYVGKYVAKVDESASAPIRYSGGDWGAWASACNCSAETAGGPLDIETYCHAWGGAEFFEVGVSGAAGEVGQSRGDTQGRCWGYWRKESLPMGRLYHDCFEFGMWIAKVKRVANRALRASWRSRPVKKRKGRGFQCRGGPGVGWSLFVDDPYQWLAYLGDVYGASVAAGDLADGRKTFFSEVVKHGR